MTISNFPQSRSPYHIKSLTLMFLKLWSERKTAFDAMLEQELKPRWKGARRK